MVFTSQIKQHLVYFEQKRVEKLIAEGRMTNVGLAKIEEAKRRGSWEQTLGTPTEIVPEDFQKALNANEKAKQFFRSLSKTNRYFFVYWIVNAKRETTRRQRIDRAVERLAAGKKLQD